MAMPQEEENKACHMATKIHETYIHKSYISDNRGCPIWPTGLPEIYMEVSELLVKKLSDHTTVVVFLQTHP